MTLALEVLNAWSYDRWVADLARQEYYRSENLVQKEINIYEGR